MKIIGNYSFTVYYENLGMENIKIVSNYILFFKQIVKILFYF